MTSPFPGMDPFLEGYLWPDVHNELASKIRRQIIPLLRPKYVARLNNYFVEDNHPESDLGIMYPDVDIIHKKSPQALKEPTATYTYAGSSGNIKTPDPAILSVPFISPVEVRIPVIEIRDRDENRLVTCIEILSPVNKRKPGLEAYLEKRRKLHRAEVHLLEIDLLRRGTRPVQHPKLKSTDYLVALTRAKIARTEIWPIRLRSPLPVIPIPLMAPDKDIALDLQQAFNEVYDEAAYELSIDYNAEPPPPNMSEEYSEWIKTLG